MREALSIQDAGASFLLLEGMPKSSAEQIAKKLKIPVYGIGAGNQTDGSLMIFHDLCGLFPDFRPYFGKCYVKDVISDFLANFPTEGLKKFGRDTKEDGLLKLSEMCLTKYVKEVRLREFPSSEYTYPIKEEELEALRHSPFWNPKNE